MTPRELTENFIAFCKEHQDEAVVKKYSRYFKDSYDAWGLTQELMDQKAREIQDHEAFTMDLLLDAAPLLFKSGKYEETAIVLSILNRRLNKLDIEVFKAISGWFSIAIRNWAHADILAMNIIPEFILRKLIRAEDLAEWTTSPFPFQRRCVPVSFIKPLKKGHELKVFLDIIEPMMRDDERVVHQGLGWFLREAWKLHPVQTESFLLKWKEISARLIFQYACEKMSREQKERFRKSKQK